MLPSLLAAADPATTTHIIAQWGDLIFTLDTLSLACAALLDFVILIVSILYSRRLTKAGYTNHKILLLSYELCIFFEGLTKVLRIGNLLTYTETFAQSPWSLPLTMCRIANATTTLMFLICFITYIWGLKMDTPNDGPPI